MARGKRKETGAKVFSVGSSSQAGHCWGVAVSPLRCFQALTPTPLSPALLSGLFSQGSAQAVCAGRTSIVWKVGRFGPALTIWKEARAGGVRFPELHLLLGLLSPQR